jgi:hypothetical protein
MSECDKGDKEAGSIDKKNLKHYFLSIRKFRSEGLGAKSFTVIEKIFFCW